MGIEAVLRRIAAAGCIVGATLAPCARAADESAAADSPQWARIRDTLFAGRSIEATAGVVSLDLPDRAEDAAVVPVSIRAQAPRQPEGYVRRIWLVIDKNPSPVGAVFTLTADSGRAEIDTRVRVEDYSTVRAIAETSDGRLYMAARYIKASGGCSAPAGKDDAAAMSRLGRIKLRTDGDVKIGQPSAVQLMISHPNHSGLVMDQVTRLFTPPRFVRTVNVSYDGRQVLSADLDFTISENPNFRFWFVPKEAGEMKVEVVDSSDAHFESRIEVRPGAAGT